MLMTIVFLHVIWITLLSLEWRYKTLDTRSHPLLLALIALGACVSDGYSSWVYLCVCACPGNINLYRCTLAYTD